jgi:hypothetical protein
MSAQLYFLLIAATGLAVTVAALWRDKRRNFNENTNVAETESAQAIDWDPLTSELSTRIFAAEDSDFVASESSRQFARAFRESRTALALDWLRGIRRQVHLLRRAHLMAARGNPDLRPADELRLGLEFLLFQVTSGILFLIIWVSGPLHAAKLVGYSLELTEQLRKMTDDILPNVSRVAVELMHTEPQGKNRTASSQDRYARRT